MHRNLGAMGTSLRVRFVQLALGFAYSFVLVLGLARAASLRSKLIAFALLFASYATGIVVPDATVPRGSWVRVCGIGILVLTGGAVAVLAGGSDALVWAVPVMAFCAGNRFKAGGLGVAGG